MFEKELNYFIKNQDSLVKKHRGKVLTIQGEKVIDVSDTPLDAYLKAEREHQLGQVMLQMCEPGAGAYTATISASRVS
jgi:hypothetical protein